MLDRLSSVQSLEEYTDPIIKPGMRECGSPLNRLSLQFLTFCAYPAEQRVRVNLSSQTPDPGEEEREHNDPAGQGVNSTNSLWGARGFMFEITFKIVVLYRGCV